MHLTATEINEILRADGAGFCPPSATHCPSPLWAPDEKAGGWPRLTDKGWSARVKLGGSPLDPAKRASILEATYQMFG